MKEEVQKILEDACRSWLREQALPPEEKGLSISVQIPPPGVAGDLATNFPLLAAKKARKLPRQVAEEMIAKLPRQGPLERAEVAGPGFLNFYLSPEWLFKELRTILRGRDTYGAKALAEGKVLMEFVSANPTGPLHVGHGRGAALGDSLARLLRHRGSDISTEYYINNVGNQVDNLAASVMAVCEELKPGTLDPEEKSFVAGRNPEEFYKGDYIRGVAGDLADENPPGKDRPKGPAFFRSFALNRLLDLIKKDLKGFGVHIDTWFPESDLYSGGRDRVEDAIAELKKKGHLREEDGALWFRSTEFGDDKDRVLKRRNERPTYFASDIAYHHDKFQRGFARLINVWGADHHGYVARVKNALQALGHDPAQLTILLNQLVSLLRDGKPVAMAKRTGEFVTLAEVVEEVGKDACRFFFASRSPDSPLEFDLELAKKQAPENPVFYVQYVHARACSLFREAEKRGFDAGGTASFPAPPGPLSPEERRLLVKLASYPDVLEQCVRDLTPHHLTAYLLALAGEYHRFYETCRVLVDEAGIRAFRLALVDGVRAVIHGGLALIGVQAPDEM